MCLMGGTVLRWRRMDAGASAGFCRGEWAIGLGLGWWLEAGAQRSSEFGPPLHRHLRAPTTNCSSRRMPSEFCEPNFCYHGLKLTHAITPNLPSSPRVCAYHRLAICFYAAKARMSIFTTDFDMIRPHLW